MNRLAADSSRHGTLVRWTGIQSCLVLCRRDLQLLELQLQSMDTP